MRYAQTLINSAEVAIFIYEVILPNYYFKIINLIRIFMVANFNPDSPQLLSPLFAMFAIIELYCLYVSEISPVQKRVLCGIEM